MKSLKIINAPDSLRPQADFSEICSFHFSFFYARILFMVEKRRRFTPDRLAIGEIGMITSIENIPDDNGSPFTMDLSVASDAWLRIIDSSGHVPSPYESIRFRSYEGGGFIPCIAEELRHVAKAFKSCDGEIPEDFNSFPRPIDDKPPSFSYEGIQTSKLKDKPRISVIGLIDHDSQRDNVEKTLDINVAQNGDVNLIMKDKRTDEGKITFKTGENGGKYPIMAAVFTRIAERIVRASRIK